MVGKRKGRDDGMKTGLTGFLFGERKGRDDGMKTGLTGFLFGERKGRDDGMKTRLTGFLVWGKKRRDDGMKTGLTGFWFGERKRKKKEGRRGWVEIGGGFRLSFSCLLFFSGLSYPIIIASRKSCTILIILSKYSVNPAENIQCKLSS